MSQTKDDEIKDPVDSIVNDLGEAKSDLVGVEEIEEDKYEDLMDETYSLSTPTPIQTQAPTDPSQVQPGASNSQAADDQTPSGQKLVEDNKDDVSTSDSESVNVPRMVKEDLDNSKSN